MTAPRRRVRLAVLCSGGGSNLQALLDRFNRQVASVARVELVVASRAGIGAVRRAEQGGVPWLVIDPHATPADAHAADLLNVLRDAGADLLVLAGYLNLLPAKVVNAYAGRILNIHPALLPAFGGRGMYGIHVHRAVLAAGVTVSGATVHYVNEQFDEGGIVAQWPVPVLPGDTPEILAARVLAVEHQLLPAVIEHLAASAETPLPCGDASFCLVADAAPSPARTRVLLRSAPSAELPAERSLQRMPRALLSVTNKEGLLEFAAGLRQRGWTLLSTGGTARVLREGGLEVTEISGITGHTEMMDGRVKTLHPAVHAGLLARRGHVGDDEQMRALGYRDIDLVAVNLYAFEETASQPGVAVGDAAEQIDIGGPSMLRSAAKNHASVWAVVDPADYRAVLGALDGAATEAAVLRRILAAKVFARTAAYDAAIAAFLTDAHGEESTPAATVSAEDPPARLSLQLQKVQDLRYGENPGQRAALYARAGEETGWRQLHGKELSYNNLLDLDAALLAVASWPVGEVAACAIIKHNTPCGVAIADTAAEAYRKALATDPASAFGSVVAFNTEVDEATAELLRPNFVEAIAAPAFATTALQLLRQKKNLRLLQTQPNTSAAAWELKSIRGGFLLQEPLTADAAEAQWRVASTRTPTEAEWRDLRFAWRAVAAVKSNAILLARDGGTLGIGAGQTSRVDASRLAVLKAAAQDLELRDASLASDAFFPFRDGVDAAASAGISAIIQPGGSVRDEEVIAAANEHGIAMVFSGQRRFRH